MLSVLTVIAQSVMVAIQKALNSSWRADKQAPFFVTVFVIFLFWITFFTIILRYELQNELDSLLTLFQCSRRGFRFLGVVFFHVILLLTVVLLVSNIVERTHKVENQTSLSPGGEFIVSAELPLHPTSTQHLSMSRTTSVGDIDGVRKDIAVPEVRRNKDHRYLTTIYKIWLTAIIYAFLYLTLENLILLYADSTLIEFVHTTFLQLVARLTGIDLSDNPAGEMLLNPLVRRRIR